MESLKDLLAKNRVLSSLSESEQTQIVMQAYRRKFARGEWLAHYGDVWPYLFLVASGTISGVKVSTEGRNLIALTLEPGDMFWGMAFFEDDSPLLLGLQAQQACQVYLWSREKLLPFLSRNGRFSWELTRSMALQMEQGRAFMEDLAFRSVRDRLAHLLLDRYGEAVGEFVARDLTLDEMAAHIGSTREVVCRLLYRFEAEGAIVIRRTEFTIADHEKLIEIANIPAGT